MSEASADLARSITRAGSKQTYYTARLMVDRDLVSDFCRAYAYFRWVDDTVDESSQTRDGRVSFIRRQRELIERLYSGERVDGLTVEERMVADLISHDRGANGGLHSFVWNMFAVIEFDAYRQGRLISQQELTWYSNTLGNSVTDGIQYFVGNGHPYPRSDNRCRAAIAAHIAHLLRDTLVDASQGYVNIPRE